jgi:hypothetical protein
LAPLPIAKGASKDYNKDEIAHRNPKEHFTEAFSNIFKLLQEGKHFGMRRFICLLLN